MKTNFLFFFVFASVTFSGFSQDPLFVNSQQSLVYLNPSFAGSNGLLRTQSVCRTPDRYALSTLYTSTTLYNGVDVYIKALKGGIAITHLHDDYKHGTLKTDVVALTYAQYFSLLDNRLKIIPSIQAAYLSKTLDKNKLSFWDPILSKEGCASQWPCGPLNDQNKRNADFSSGLLVNYKEFYFGASLLHLSQPNVGLVGDSRLPAKLTIHSSYNQRLNMWIMANIFGQYQRHEENHFAQAKINFLFVNHVIFGLGYHSNNSASANIGYKNQFFTIGMGYDQRVTLYTDQLNGGWEAHFSLNIRKKEDRKTVTAFERW
ncbi:MAG: type IX secretion system membrane protein PorP/SprF [Bacteroidota bacterium]